MNKRLHLVTTLPLMVLVGAVCFLLLLPSLLDRFLLPRLIDKLPFTEKELHLSRVSLWNIQGRMSLADEHRPALSIPRFVLRFTPRSLLHRQISELLIDSATVHIDLDNGRPRLRGRTGTPASGDNEEIEPLLLPVAIETIIVQNSTIILHREGQSAISFIVDSALKLQFTEQAGGRKLLSVLTAEAQVKGDLLATCTLEARATADGHEVNLQIEVSQIDQLVSIFPQLGDVEADGHLFIRSQAKLDHRRRLSEYQATAELSGFRYRNKTVIFESGATDKPVTVQIEGDMEKSRYILDNLSMGGPGKGSLDLHGEVDLSQGIFNGIGTVVIEDPAILVALNFNGSHTGSATTSTTSIDYQLQAETFVLAEKLIISPVVLDGEVLINNAGVLAQLNAKVASVTDKMRNTLYSDIALHLPLDLPLTTDAAGSAGTLSIGEIRYQGINSGRLEATLTPSMTDLAFKVLIDSPFFPEKPLSCDGLMQKTFDMSIRCRLAETQIDSALLPASFGIAKDLSFSGRLAVEGEFHLQNRQPHGKLTAGLHAARLAYKENIIADINMDIVFPRLPIVQSSPSQLCTIGSLNLGRIAMSDAQLHFRIDDQDTVFLEKSRFNWCGGKVESGSFKITRAMEELDTTLYCDRIGFTLLLEQFGIENAEGEGSLNGRLPILLNSEGITFDDGFLFSTPGKSGIVRFNNTNQLRSGMPDISNSAYLDYSMKALENFAYNWTKLSFNSHGEDLLITMQLDGKPAEPLAFGYKNGQIVASDQGSGLQHPITLDVNFRLPLHSLFLYGKNIHSRMENK